MSEYRMDISGTIELADYSSIYDYMAIVNRNDNLIITINNGEGENVNLICKMLENNNFIVDSNNKNNEGKCYIKASRDSIS